MASDPGLAKEMSQKIYQGISGKFLLRSGGKKEESCKGKSDTFFLFFKWLSNDTVLKFLQPSYGHGDGEG